MKVAYDIGCNIGSTTQQLLDIGFELVIGVDADIRCIEHCQKRFAGDSRVIVLHRLVCNETNTIKDFYQAKKSIVSTASKDWIDNCRFAGKTRWKKTQVKTMSLQDIIDCHTEEANFIKIDVEGYEYEVIKSLKIKQGILAFEWSEENYEYVAKPCIEHLKTLGYTKWSYTNRDKLTFKHNWQKELDIGELIPSRKYRWGMIWCK